MNERIEALRRIPALLSNIDRALSDIRDLVRATPPTTLSEWMKYTGISQQRLALILGVSQGTVSRWLEGARPHPAVRRQLTALVGADLFDTHEGGAL